MSDLEAKGAYQANLDACLASIDELKKLLKKHKDKFESEGQNADWGFVGDLDLTAEKLDEIIDFLLG